MKYIYYDDRGVAMISEGQIDAPNFKVLKINLTADEEDKLKHGGKWENKVENNKLVFTKKWQVAKNEDLLAKVDQAQGVPELKNLIKDLILFGS